MTDNIINFDEFMDSEFPNDEITLMLHWKSWKQKPTSEDFKKMSYKMTTQTVTFNQLVQFITFGRTCRPAILAEGGASDKDFLGQQAFFIDVDGTRTVAQSIAICKRRGIVPNIIYPSFNFGPTHQKHRLVFIAPDIIRDVELRKQIQKELSDIFLADPMTIPPHTMFAGGQTYFWADDIARLDINELLSKGSAKGGENHVA